MHNKDRAAKAAQVMLDYSKGATIEQKERNTGSFWQVVADPTFDWTRYNFRVAVKLDCFWCIRTDAEVFAIYPSVEEANSNLESWAKYGAYVQKLLPAPQTG